MSNNNLRIPAENSLPFKFADATTIGEGKDSVVDKIRAEVTETQSGVELKDMALKEMKREEYADIDEMKKSKGYYEFLKQFPEFGKFVPETTFFVAKKTEGEKPHGYSIQKFLPGRRLFEVPKQELYENKENLAQLLEFAKAALQVIEACEKDTNLTPDFGASGSGFRNQIMTGLLNSPRHTTNVMLTDFPNESGKKISFVDVGIRTSARKEKPVVKQIISELRTYVLKKQFERWIRELEQRLKKF
ncbi:MAG TPA: hypothetical protein VEA59_00735 [Patescibacteria group bacterium]|nr:hypothetical protein [Patescibacteria group bacterium]